VAELAVRPPGQLSGCQGVFDDAGCHRLEGGLLGSCAAWWVVVGQAHVGQGGFQHVGYFLVGVAEGHGGEHPLADWGANSPGRLVTQALEATWAARETLAHLGTPSDRLIIWRRGWRPHSTADDPSQLFETGWQDNVWHNRRGNFGDQVRLNLRRLRRTVVIAHRRTPTQHTRETHDTRYVLPDPRTHAEAAPKISAGVADAIASAYTIFRAQASRTDSDPSGDTATTGCTGYHASPFSEPGQPCRASFLACTACPNAVVTPRHLPRLAYLHQALDQLRTVLEPETWQQDWAAPFQRLHDLISGPHFTSTEWDDALRQVSAVDATASTSCCDGASIHDPCPQPVARDTRRPRSARLDLRP
jgi:hypothetical protein